MDFQTLSYSLEDLVDLALCSKDPNVLMKLAEERNPLLMIALSKNIHLPKELVPVLLKQNSWEIIENLASNDHLSVAELKQYISSKHYCGDKQILLEKLLEKGELDTFSDLTQLAPETCLLFLEQHWDASLAQQLNWRDKKIALTLCRISELNSSTLEQIAEHYQADMEVINLVIEHPRTTSETLLKLLNLHEELAPKILAHKNITEKHIKELLKSKQYQIPIGKLYSGIFLNPNLSPSFIRTLYRKVSIYEKTTSEWLISLICNPNTPEDILKSIYQYSCNKSPNLLSLFLVRPDMKEEDVLNIIKIIPLTTPQKHLILRNYSGYPQVIENFLDDPVEEIQQEARQIYQELLGNL